ncbi:MAG: hypothetical protein Q9N32_04165 [Gammaproteobacteria bacterium]|nr:hypothetical protein [Gammaproteobacteria bacterium]
MKEALLFEEEADADLVTRVVYTGYVADPTDDEFLTMGQDHF